MPSHSVKDMQKEARGSRNLSRRSGGQKQKNTMKKWLAIGVLGLLLGMTGRAWAAVSDGLTITITPQWMLQAALLAIGGGLLGALYPAWRAATLDPVDALQYE